MYRYPRKNIANSVLYIDELALGQYMYLHVKNSSSSLSLFCLDVDTGLYRVYSALM